VLIYGSLFVLQQIFRPEFTTKRAEDTKFGKETDWISFAIFFALKRLVADRESDRATAAIPSYRRKRVSRLMRTV